VETSVEVWNITGACIGVDRERFELIYSEVTNRDILEGLGTIDVPVGKGPTRQT